MKQSILFKSISIIIASILLLAIILIIYNEIDDKRLRDNFGSIAVSSEYNVPLKLDKFPVYKQCNSWSCGPTTIRMVYDYLKGLGNEKQALDESIFADRNGGMFPGTFEQFLRDCLPGYNVELSNCIPDSEVVKIVYSQLKQGMPVPVYFSTVNEWDKPNYDTHYSVVIGIDLKKDIITIANAYGFEEEVSVSEFLGSLKYDNYKNEPLPFRLATMIGIVRKNNIYVLRKD